MREKRIGAMVRRDETIADRWSCVADCRLRGLLVDTPLYSSIVRFNLERLVLIIIIPKGKLLI